MVPRGDRRSVKPSPDMNGGSGPSFRAIYLAVLPDHAQGIACLARIRSLNRTRTNAALPMTMSRGLVETPLKRRRRHALANTFNFNAQELFL